MLAYLKSSFLGDRVLALAMDALTSGNLLMQRFKALELAVDHKIWSWGRLLQLGKLGGERGGGATTDPSAQLERSCEAKGWHGKWPGWGSGRWVTEPSRPETSSRYGTSRSASHRDFRQDQETHSCPASSSWWRRQRRGCGRDRGEQLL